MFEREFPVLVVDDDADVLAVTRLALKNVEIYGVPVKVYTAASAAEAIEVIKANFLTQYGSNHLAVAFIDVVMETDTAGLDLCRYIRQDMNSKNTQLYIRTGQPGTAPERSVIDEYDINGYFTKVEMSEDKLYSMVKSGIRQYYYMGYSSGFSAILANALPLSRSRQHLGYFLSQITKASLVNEAGQEMTDREVMAVFTMDKDFIAVDGVTEEEGRARIGEALASQGIPLGNDGDWYSVGDKALFIHIAESATTAEHNNLTVGTMQPPDFLVQIMYQNLRGLAILWKFAP